MLLLPLMQLLLLLLLQVCFSYTNEDFAGRVQHLREADSPQG